MRVHSCSLELGQVILKPTSESDGDEVSDCCAAENSMLFDASFFGGQRAAKLQTV